MGVQSEVSNISSNTQAFPLTRVRERDELGRFREKILFLPVVLFLGQGLAYRVQIGLKLVTLLPPSLKCWGDRCIPPHPASTAFLTHLEKILPKHYKPEAGNQQPPRSWYRNRLKVLRSPSRLSL